MVRIDLHKRGGENVREICTNFGCSTISNVQFFSTKSVDSVYGLVTFARILLGSMKSEYFYNHCKKKIRLEMRSVK
jgi:hypothetical protein